MKKETIRALLILVMSFLVPLTFGIVIGGFFVLDKHPSVIAFGVVLVGLCVFLRNVTRHFSIQQH